jgi:hypothetical protein
MLLLKNLNYSAFYLCLSALRRNQGSSTDITSHRCGRMVKDDLLILTIIAFDPYKLAPRFSFHSKHPPILKLFLKKSALTRISLSSDKLFFIFIPRVQA